MKGKLDEFTVRDLIQQYCLEKRTARLILQHQKNVAEVYIKDGDIVHAKMDKQAGEMVIHQVLQWQNGNYETQDGKQPPAITIDRFWLNLLLEDQLPTTSSTPSTNPAQTPSPPKDKQAGFSPDLFLQEIGSQLNGYLGSAIVSQKGVIIAQHITRKLYLEEALPYILQLIKILPVIIEKSALGQFEEDLFTTDSAYCLVRALPNNQAFLLVFTDRSARGVGSLLFFSRTIAEQIPTINLATIAAPASSQSNVRCLYQTTCPVYQRKIKVTDERYQQIKNLYCLAEFRACAVFELIQEINRSGLPINMYYSEIQALVRSL
jgi:hypothetical protein